MHTNRLLDKQQQFLENIADVTAFVGPRAIGKTHALLRCGLQHTAIEPIVGFDGLVITPQPATLMRHTYAICHDMGALIPQFNSSRQMLIWPGYSTKLTFMQMHNDDVEQLKGRVAHFVGIDDLNRFSPKVMYILLRRLRSLNEIYPMRMRVTFSQEEPSPPMSNEMAITPSWAWQFFSPWLDPNHPASTAYGEVRYFEVSDLLQSGPIAWATADLRSSLSSSATVIR